MNTAAIRLSDHFTLAEAARSQTAVRYEIDNLPPRDLTPALAGVAENILEPVRAHYRIPFSPTSWYRCEALERRLCWKSFLSWCERNKCEPDEESWEIYFGRKQHPKGNAVDFELPGVSNYKLAKWIMQHVEFDQLILEFHTWGKPNSGWVHASYVEGENRGQVLTVGRGQSLEGLPDYD